MFARTLLSFFLIFCLCFNALAQKPSVYHPLVNNTATDQTILVDIEARLKVDISQLTGPNKKYQEELYKERVKLIKDQFDDQIFVTNDTAQTYLNQLVAEIGKANPGFNLKDLRIYFSRAWWPNASSMGEGTILFNISLFNRLNNESQAAFVLCHELSHYFLNHSNQNIDRYVNTLYSDKMQKELKEIAKQEYGKNSKLESLAKGLLFRSRRHGREYEKAADSMAVQLMKNSRFDMKEALSCLALLDSVDTDKYKNNLLLERRFSFPAYPFKKSWLEKEETLSFKTEEVDKKLEDSLKTHPDCTQRIENLKLLIASLQQSKTTQFVTSPASFTNIKSNFDYEIIQWCYDSKRVSRALYYTLEMLEEQKDNPFLHSMIVRCLNKIYEAQKEHHLTDYVDIPTTGKDDKYNDLLQFIQNIRLKDIASLSFRYIEQYADFIKQYPHYEELYSTSHKNFVNHP